MHYLLILTFLLAPAYTVKFNIGPMPANLLMVWVIFVWAAFVVNLFAKKDIKKIFGAVKNTNRKILVFTSLFFLSGVVGLFWNGFNTSKLGQFVVLFLQPVSIFFIAGFEWQKSPNSKRLLLAACRSRHLLHNPIFYALGIVAGLLGKQLGAKKGYGFFCAS